MAVAGKALNRVGLTWHGILTPALRGVVSVEHHKDCPSRENASAAGLSPLLDPLEVAQWMVPEGMTAHVHRFDAHEGGYFRISLTYNAPIGAGKTTPHGDTYHGRFVRLDEDRDLVQKLEFETADPAMQGEMT
jgi:hypothetical protein